MGCLLFKSAARIPSVWSISDFEMVKYTQKGAINQRRSCSFDQSVGGFSDCEVAGIKPIKNTELAIIVDFDTQESNNYQ
jgi:hypothetical protein